MLIMKFGLSYDFLSQDTSNPVDMRKIREISVLAEQLGFDAILAGESHRAVRGHLPAPLLGLAAVAACTKKIEIGTNVLLLTTYNPLRFAEETAVLDCLSNGRLILGLSLGARTIWNIFSIPPSDSAQYFDEELELLTQLWTKPKVTFAGKYFQYQDASISPKPIQKPYPTILVGGTLAKSFQRASKYGGYIGAGNYGASWLSERFPSRKGSGAGQVKFVSLNRATLICKPDSALTKANWTSLREYSNYYHSRGDLKVPFQVDSLDEPETLQKILGELAIAGTPDECIALIERYGKMGIDQLNLRLTIPGVNETELKDMMHLLSEKVFSYFGKTSSDRDR